IALLQEEIARLEGEIHARDEAMAGVGEEPVRDDTSASEAVETRTAELTAELANRDETTVLLLEQVRLFEEAGTANRANWDLLDQWVQELERRVEQKGANAEARAALDAERRKSENDREAFDTERRSWESQKTTLEAEAEQLRATLAKA